MDACRVEGMANGGSDPSSSYLLPVLAPNAQQKFKLLVPSEQRHRYIGPLGLEPVLDSAHTCHLPHVHRLDEVLQRMLGEIAVLEQIADQPMRLGTDQKRVGLSQSLQTRSKV